MDNEDGLNEGIWGLPLGKNMRVENLDVLAEPLPSSKQKVPRRAAVLVSQNTGQTIDYCLYDLQVSVKRPGFSDSYHDIKPYSIVARENIKGAVKYGAEEKGTITSVFLAGASFDYDLVHVSRQTSDQDATIATLGVTRSPGGMDAVVLKTYKKVEVASIVKGEEVSNVRLGDILSVSRSDQPSLDCTQIGAFVWTIELLDGHILCWKVPYWGQGGGCSKDIWPCFDRNDKLHRPKGLTPPVPIKSPEDNDAASNFPFGVVCHIGNSTDWMQQSSSGTQTDIALGLVPESAFGCILRAGQHAVKIQRSGVGGDFDAELFASDFLESQIFSPSDLQMMPPTFVPSLYMISLEAAYLRQNSAVDGSLELGGTNARWLQVSTILENCTLLI